MKDIQSQLDHRRINIKKVGVKNISYPITVLDKAKKHQRTIATVNMYVNLPHRFKGTHMSRFIEILNRFHGEIDVRNFHLILEEMKARLEAEEAHIEIEFPYFLEKKREDNNAACMSEYTCKMHGSFGEEYNLTLGMSVPISPPPPWQSFAALPRSLGRWGAAHVHIRFRHFVWIEDLIHLVEQIIMNSRWSLLADNAAGPAAYSPVESKARHTAHGPLTNLVDQSTGAGLQLPGSGGGQTFSMSVENMTKALGKALTGLPDIKWFSITVENFAEGYNVFSFLEWPS
jgi:GTP cyclohydrolase I